MFLLLVPSEADHLCPSKLLRVPLPLQVTAKVPLSIQRSKVKAGTTFQTGLKPRVRAAPRHVNACMQAFQTLNEQDVGLELSNHFSPKFRNALT